jgi:Domain of unknown function (DUF4193)
LRARPDIYSAAAGAGRWDACRPIPRTHPKVVMSNEDLEEATEPDLSDADVDEDELDEEDLGADDLDDDAEVEVEDVVEVDAVVDIAVDPAVAVAVAVDPVVAEPDAEPEPVAAKPAKRARRKSDDDDDVLDLDEELHPDDVEEPLDVLLKERTASGALEEDDEAEEEIEVDERGETPTRIVPRRADEFLCSSCFLVLPRSQLADEKRMLCRDCV